MPQLELLDNNIACLRLGGGENRFTEELLAEAHRCLDAIPSTASGLVTMGSGKFFSNGLADDARTGGRFPELVSGLQELLGRVLTLPVPTIAAVNGHAFGAGALLALAHDYRFMRSDRGYFCLPEVDIEVPLTEGMASLVQVKLTPRVASAAMLTGRRYGAVDALRDGIVDHIAQDNVLLDVAAAHLTPPVSGKNPSTLGAIKSAMYRHVTDKLQRAQ